MSAILSNKLFAKEAYFHDSTILSLSNLQLRQRQLKNIWVRIFNIVASYGHVRDLLPKEGAVDPNHDFAMHYELIEKNEKHVAAIVRP